MNQQVLTVEEDPAFLACSVADSVAAVLRPPTPARRITFPSRGRRTPLAIAFLQDVQDSWDVFGRPAERTATAAAREPVIMADERTAEEACLPV
jgi:hypothetical protein